MGSSYFSLKDFIEYLEKNMFYSYDTKEDCVVVKLTENDTFTVHEIDFKSPPTTVEIKNSYLKDEYIKFYSRFSRFIPNDKLYVLQNNAFIGVISNGKLTSF